MQPADVKVGETYFWRDDRALPWLAQIVGPVRQLQGRPVCDAIVFACPGGPDEIDRATKMPVEPWRLMLTKAEWAAAADAAAEPGKRRREAWRAEDRAWAPLLHALEAQGVQVDPGQGLTGKCTRRFRLDREQAEQLLAMLDVAGMADRLGLPWVAVGASSAGLHVAGTAVAGALRLEYADEHEGPLQALAQLEREMESPRG